MPHPKILLYGSFAFTDLASSYLRAFQAIGCEATALDNRIIDQHLQLGLNNRLINRLMLNNLAYRRAAARRWNHFVTDVVLQHHPDLFFIIKGNLLFPETITEIQRHGIKVFIFHPDTPFATSINHRPEIMPTAKASDVYFIWSHRLQADLQAAGLKQVEYLPFAWDAETFPYQTDVVGRFEHDVVFIGGWDKERELLLTTIAQHYNLKIWGPSYWMTRTKRNSPLKKCWQGRAVDSIEASYILSRSRIPLNILRRQNLPDGNNMRTFEQPGCGAFTLSNYASGAAEMLTEGDAVAYFRSAEDCLVQIEQYCANDPLRIAMTQHAHHIVQTEHQYHHRAATILQAL